MSSFPQTLRGIFRWAWVLLGISFLLWLWEPVRSLSQGLVLGIFTSILYGWNLYRTTWRITEAAIHRRGRRPGGSGMTWRIAVVAAAVYLVIRRPEWFSVWGFFAGLFVVQILYVLQTLWSTFRDNK